MKLLYSTNEHYYSRLHRRLANEPFTHIGILFFEGTLDLVLDCTKPYSKLYHLKHWKKLYTIIDHQEFCLTSTEENEYYKRATNYCLLKPYDWGAYAYAWVQVMKHRLTGSPYPETNPWRGDGMWCTEVIYPLINLFKRDFDMDLSKVDLAAKTPFMLKTIIDEIRNGN